MHSREEKCIFPLNYFLIPLHSNWQKKLIIGYVKEGDRLLPEYIKWKIIFQLK